MYYTTTFILANYKVNIPEFVNELKHVTIRSTTVAYNIISILTQFLQGYEISVTVSFATEYILFYRVTSYL